MVQTKLLSVALVFAALLIALIPQPPSPAFSDSSVDIVGTFFMIWSDLPPDADPNTFVRAAFLLSDSAGNTYLLNLDEKLTQEDGGPMRLNRHEVEVMGVFHPETNTIDVESIHRTDQIPPIGSHLMGAHVSGSKKWVTVLCRFGDETGVTPQPASYFVDLIDFMNDYWKELSYDIANLDGSSVVGWYDMAQARAAYMDDPMTHFAGHTLNWDEIASDCTAAADADVNFPDFDGINLIFNDNLDCCAWGGSVTLTRDGVTKTYSATWMPPWGWGSQRVLGQEMGHGFGLPHSSGPYSATYDSKWDVMSSGGICAVPDVDFGCLGDHTISFHKDALGWISPARVYTATSGPDQLIFLERLAQPVSATDYLEAHIAIGGSSTNFYTVESRQFAGFDNEIPAEAVVIHNVDTTRSDRLAQVVDVDAVPNTNPNDAGARWLQGELFEDSVNNISVAIKEETSGGFWVIINPTVADLSISKTGSPDPVAAGSSLTYTITVNNAGPDTANNVQVVDVLPSGVTYASDTDSCVESPSGTLTCNLGSIAAGGSASFDVTVNVPSNLAYTGTTSLDNDVSVTSDQFDQDQSDNSQVISTELIAEADLEITSFTASSTPDQLVIGNSIEVTLEKTIVNNGPSSPVDVNVDVSSAGTGGLDIAPAAANSLVTALATGGTPATVVETFDVTCTGPGPQEVTFTDTISPVNGVDPNTSNNAAQITIQIECVIPVAINIHPGSSVNPVNVNSKTGVIPVAILTTSAGEYGLPMAIDATMINPLSVHFGPGDVLLNVNPPGGATEFHGRGHLSDSFELDEVTRDGDLDMLLHFKTPATGLDSSDTEACVIGQINIGGVMYTFYGCDTITVIPRP